MPSAIGAFCSTSRMVTPCALDRKSTRLNSSHLRISYAVFCLKKKKKEREHPAHGRDDCLDSADDTRSLSVAQLRCKPRVSAASTHGRAGGPFFFFFLINRGPPEFSPLPHPAPFPT